MTIIFDKSKKISLDDESFRSELLSIASKIDDVIPLGRGDPDFHTPKPVSYTHLTLPTNREV